MLTAQNIKFSYGEGFTIDQLSFKINQSEIVGLIGQSGSGKSTFLKIMAGLLQSSSGELKLDEEIIQGPDFKLVPGHKSIKLVNQSNSLFPNINIFENIVYELRKFKKEYQDKRVSYLTKKLKINHLTNKLPRELSGGEIQRVMIAKAIADEPKVLLLDEPFANLDGINKRNAMLLLQKIVIQENIACVLVTHDIQDAFGMADRLIIMKDGKIVQEGSSENIYFKPKNKYVANLTGETFAVNFEDRKFNIRPENFILSDNGKYSAVVEKSIFRGAFFEILFYYENQLLYLRSQKSLIENSNFKFDINISV